MIKKGRGMGVTLRPELPQLHVLHNYAVLHNSKHLGIVSALCKNPEKPEEGSNN